MDKIFYTFRKKSDNKDFPNWYYSKLFWNPFLEFATRFDSLDRIKIFLSIIYHPDCEVVKVNIDAKTIDVIGYPKYGLGGNFEIVY